MVDVEEVENYVVQEKMIGNVINVTVNMSIVNVNVNVKLIK